MRIIATGDWHLGNLFHGNDRLPEHKHFLNWLLAKIGEKQPDALLIAGDIFDNGNPSAASQSAYYEFLADATAICPKMQIVITSGNHDSASRLEAPRPLLSRHKVEIRGRVHRVWQDDGWVNDYDDLIIPVNDEDGMQIVILAVPFLRSDIIQNENYSKGVGAFLEELTARAKELYPGNRMLMMAHMYAKGADIAKADASEKIVIGGQEEIQMDGWTSHPDYLTCGHIHKRQHIRNTDWARYTGSILPMSFAEAGYRHGVDLVTMTPDNHPSVEFIEYQPQHKLIILPDTEGEITLAKLRRIINDNLRPRQENGGLSESFDYVMLKVRLAKINNDIIKELEDLVNSKDAVLCKIQKVMPGIDVSTISDNQKITSVDDILARDPMDTLREAYQLEYQEEMSDLQTKMLQELLQGIVNQTND